ncbi:PAS-domain containing protein, partial [Rhodococcoides yunnanense]|uniref:PAS-domain containing protein n=1 Tax=Rhodococcoides yunnanense TaxID=278209 RepID=UPI0022B20447
PVVNPDIGPLEAISEGILLLDTAGSVVWFNQRLAELFGFPPEGMHKKTREEALAAMSARMVDAEAYVRRVREIIANDEPCAR